jgi:hypothetical protein
MLVQNRSFEPLHSSSSVLLKTPSKPVRDATCAEFNPWFMEAYNLCKLDPCLKPSWGLYLKAACNAYKVDRLSHVQTNQVCYHWLASVGYHKLKII